MRRALLLMTLLLAGCATQAPVAPKVTEVERGLAVEYDYDILIKGGTIYDGSGGKPYVADIGVKDGLINAVYPKLKGEAAVEIDAKGKAVAPGFIGSGNLQSGFVVDAGRCDESGLAEAPLTESVRRLTSERAEQLGMKEHGRIMPGWAADIVVFHSRRLPLQEEVDDVIIGGVMAIQDGRPTGRTPPLARKMCGS